MISCDTLQEALKFKDLALELVKAKHKQTHCRVERPQIGTKSTGYPHLSGSSTPPPDQLIDRCAGALLG